MKYDTERENDSIDNTLGMKLGNVWVYKTSEKNCQNHEGLQTEKGKEEESIRLGGVVAIPWSLALDK